MTVAFPCADYIRYDRYEISMSCLDPGYFVLLDELRCTGSEDYMRLCHWLAEVCRETKVVRISDYSIGPSSLYVPMSEHRTVRPGYPTVKLTSEGSDFNDQGLQSTHTSLALCCYCCWHAECSTTPGFQAAGIVIKFTSMSSPRRLVGFIMSSSFS